MYSQKICVCKEATRILKARELGYNIIMMYGSFSYGHISFGKVWSELELCKGLRTQETEYLGH
jgi:hypothetical protein